MVERRDGQDYLVEAIRRIDSRTEEIDARLRDVEKKIYNGFTHEIARTAKNVDELISEQKRLREQAERRLAYKEERDRQRVAIYKAIGAFAAIAGVVFGVVRLL